MIRPLIKTLCVMISLMVLFGCNTINSSKQSRQNSLNDFTTAMRWNRFPVAAGLMSPELREDFVNTFEAVKQIHIIDVRVVNMQPKNEGRRLFATIEMQYYLPPSATVKTFRFDQTWDYFDAKDQPLQGFFIVTPFPVFP